MTAFDHVGSSISTEHVAGMEVSQKRTILYNTVSAVMLLVGTQPLRSQHPPLTARPLSSPNLRVEGGEGGEDVRGEAPGTNLAEEATLSGSGAAAGDVADEESDGRAWFSAARRSREGENSGERYADVPSLSAFLNPPTLRPSQALSLSHTRRPPPARYQTAALAIFYLFIFYFCCTLRMTQTFTQQ